MTDWQQLIGSTLLPVAEETGLPRRRGPLNIEHANEVLDFIFVIVVSPSYLISSSLPTSVLYKPPIGLLLRYVQSSGYRKGLPPHRGKLF